MRSKNLFANLRKFISERFNLDADNANQEDVINNIDKGIIFKGTNLWILIFATFIASLGLNVNSTAVIIGAMLVSPLMGPIMGVGLAVGITDFDMLKRALRDFGLMVVVALLTSTLYFMISPVSYAQSELLARTMPTTYDVLIAFFGGLACFVAMTRKERVTSAILGVAIATALMPPLCTAGYGLATGQFNFFAGALYLFFINTVFIAFATFFIVRFLKYKKVSVQDEEKERRVKRIMTFIIICTFIPSIFISFGIFSRTIFENNANKFINNAFKIKNTIILDHTFEYRYKGDSSRIAVVIMGESISAQTHDMMVGQLHNYGLRNTKLEIRQANGENSANVDSSIFTSNITQILNDKNDQIANLKRQLELTDRETINMVEIAKEAEIVVGNISSLSVDNQIVYNTQGAAIDTITVCIVQPSDYKSTFSREKLTQWLKVRLNKRNVEVFIAPKNGL